MLFNSPEFFAFLLIVLLVYYLFIPARVDRLRKAFLVAASYLFYMSWNPPFGLLLLFSTVLDYNLARRMGRVESRAGRRTLLALSLLGNLGLLAYFKYGEFLTRSAYQLLGMGATAVPSYLSDIVLPVGISFYTFQTLSYTIDVYRRRQPVSTSLLDFALFVSFFPQLVAGPIVRSVHFLPQLGRPRTVDAGDVEQGLMRIWTGLLKKVVFADMLGAYVDVVFGQLEVYRGLNVLLAIYAYAFQIYFDFSGYSDIAIGLGRLFGLRIPENFNRPYLASSPQELWRRWHISLSTWLRDYLYISLGGSRGTELRTYLNLMLTMALGGLWHGASWNFVLWGVFHGALLAVHRALAGARGEGQARTPRWLRQIVTFHLVCLGWVLFRSPDLATAVTVLMHLGQWELVPSLAVSQAAILLLVAGALHVFADVRGLRRAFVAMPAWLQGLGYAGIATLVFLFSPATAQFIYFRF